jgi:hypothetical protein
MKIVATMAVLVVTLSVGAIPALAQSAKFSSRGRVPRSPDTVPLAPAQRVAA